MPPRFILALAALAAAAFADPPVPPSLLDPRNSAEAWNVIRLATANVDRLIAEQRLRELPVQVSYCSPALRALGRAPELAEASEVITRTLGWGGALAAASLENNAPRVLTMREHFRTHLAELAGKFDPATLEAEIFLCTKHPDFLSADPATPCLRCGAKLSPRRIPYSFLYVKPGEPTVRLTGAAAAPLAAGRVATVNFQLRHRDGSPMKIADLLVTHTQPIHVLIQEPGLGDFHRIAPQPASAPGEYTFTFTPTKPGPHRMWADITPAETALQELPHLDLASDEPAGKLTERTEQLTATATPAARAGTFGGSGIAREPLHFQLALSTPPLRARQPGGLRVTVTDSAGQPFTQLEPLMNAFAHLTGFYDDYETVVHLHPGTGEIFMTEARGGPTLLFTCYPPRAGFLRLYGQLQVDGAPVVVAFGLNVEP